MDTKKIINLIEDLSLDVEKCEFVIDNTCTIAINDSSCKNDISVLLCVALDYIDIINKKIDDLTRLL